MSAITAFTDSQDRAGREVAQSIAAFVEETRSQDLTQLSTKADLQAAESKIEQKLHELEMRLNSRMQWTAFIQILTTVGALVALAKLL